MLKLTKALNYDLPCLKILKDLTFAHLLFTATCLRMNSPVNQTNLFFQGFLSDSVEITSCEYTI